MMKLNKQFIWGALLSALIVLLPSCEKFVDINKSPATVYDVDPVTFLFNIQNQSLTPGNVWSDQYALKLRWMQYCANIWGYAQTNFSDVAGFGGSLYNEYNEMGKYASHIPYYIETNMPEKMEQYTTLIQVSQILLISKGIQTTDTWGSLVYTEGWSARKGEENYTPAYETQEQLFDVWDKELKEAASKLVNVSNQISIKNYDMAYAGDAKKWSKAANALRLRIALRLMKRNPEKSKAIASEVFSGGNIFNNIDDSFILYFDNFWTTVGDWHSVIDMDRASAPFMSYLKKYNDPRKRLFFQINNLTESNIAEYNSLPENVSRQIPTDFTRWEGGTVSFDYRATDARYMARSLNGVDMRAMNRPQTRLWKAAQDNGSGGSWVPMLTYADFCFMAAEFALEGVSTSKSAKEWYEDGVRSSIRQWNDIASYCQINDYQSISSDEIEHFLAQEDIAWNDSRGKEQIYCQSYVEHFKNSNETWAMWRRTGFPNEECEIITFDPVMVNGEKQQVPRRKKMSYPAEGSANYENVKQKLDEMAKEPDFGDITDEFGHLWWDKK